jgi:hypothetical protein
MILSPIPDVFAYGHPLHCTLPAVSSMVHNCESQPYFFKENSSSHLFGIENATFSDHKKAIQNDTSIDPKKAAAIIECFRNNSFRKLSKSQMIKSSMLTDTRKNRHLINLLVAEGRLTLEGRSRSTRYRLTDLNVVPAAGDRACPVFS